MQYKFKSSLTAMILKERGLRPGEESRPGHGQHQRWQTDRGGGAVRGERSNPVGGEVSGGLVGNAGYNKQNDRGRGVLVVSRKKKKHDQTA